MNIVAWSKNAPWPEDRQVEQDLVRCRALVEIFSDDFLGKELRFRGGTALNKLHFAKPYRRLTTRMSASRSALRSRSPHGSARFTTAPRSFRSKSRIRGSQARQISSPSAAKKFSLPNSARCSSATRVGTLSTSQRLSR